MPLRKVADFYVMRKNNIKNTQDNSIATVAIATAFTILPLAGIYMTPEGWWGLLLKALFLIIILGTVQNYFLHPMWRKHAELHSFVEGVILNMLWFSCIYFFYPHWIIYIFILILILSLSTLKRILQKYYYAL